MLHAHPFQIRIQLCYLCQFPRTGLGAPARVRPGPLVLQQLRPQPLEVRVVVPEEEVVRAAAAVGPPPPVEGHHSEVARETHQVVAAPRRCPRRVSWSGKSLQYRGHATLQANRRLNLPLEVPFPAIIALWHFLFTPFVPLELEWVASRTVLCLGFRITVFGSSVSVAMFRRSSTSWEISEKLCFASSVDNFFLFA